MSDAAMNAFRRFKSLHDKVSHPHGAWLKVKNENPVGFQKLAKLVRRGYHGTPSDALKLLPEYESLKKEVFGSVGGRRKTRRSKNKRGTRRR